jgi:peptide/nickel transport system substrate-binding protein
MIVMSRALLFVLLVSSLLTPAMLNVNAQPQKGPSLNEIQFIHYLDENVAVQEVKAGNLDLYFFRIPLELVSANKNDPNVKIYESIGGSLSILLNPAPDPNGLNPFSISDVRFAMNYLINRQLIVDEILKGYGAPMHSAFSQFDPDYLVLIDTIESFGFNYNPQLADSMITKAMQQNGASKGADGKWYFNNKPIELKFMIRSDDPKRNAVGELISSELERVGFTVSKDFGDLNKAFTVVYGDDPQKQGWHLYTEGWGGRAGFVRYDSVIGAQMYAPWYANMPGFQIPGAWNYQNEKLDDLSKRILTGNFTSEEERNQLLRDTVKTGVEESVRIFIASLIDPYIASSKMEGVVNDFSAGVTSRFTLIDARVPDKDNLKVGVKQIYQGAWNPVGGFRDVYASRIWMGITDPGAFRNPYTGDVIPVRTSFDVTTAGPTGKLDVPSDAILWDPVNEKWIDAGSGKTAISKVTYDLTYSKWHNGIPMDKNDILHSFYFTFEWGTDEGDNDRTKDSEFTSQIGQLLPTIKGIKFISDNNVEVYIDYWHYDEGEIADYMGAWTSMPWEIFAAMEKVVMDGNAAFSKAEADSKNVDWLSLIISGNADKVKEVLAQFKQDKFVPKALQGLSAEQAAARYDASIKWINEKKHAVISNGPFYLENYNPQARTITIKAFRDSSYPYEVGKWRDFEEAKIVTIGNVAAPLSISKGTSISISGDVKSKSDPSNVQLYYFMKNSEGKIVVKGMITPSSDSKFQIQLSGDDTSKLSTGSNQLKLFAISNVALKPDVYTTSIIGMPGQVITPPPPTDQEPSKQANISVAIKHTKKITLMAVKNNDDESINGLQIKITDGNIRFVKARGWDRDKIDPATVIVQTSDRAIDAGKSLIILLIVDNKQSSFEWSAFDKNGAKIASGTSSAR